MSRFLGLITLSIAAILLLPDLLQEGMFVDGVTYASMSRNMAEGQGSFWYIYYTPTLFPEFHVHPPLAIGILSVFYRIFGDYLWVEKAYTFLTFLISAFFISKIWQEIISCKDNKKFTYHTWLPLLFWLIIPCVHWAYRANMLENTMSIFTTCAAWLMLRGIHKSTWRHFVWAGFFIFLAVLTKGMIALFVWGIPFSYWLFTQKITFKKMVIYSLIIILIPIICMVLLCLIWEDAATGLTLYTHDFLNNVHSQTVGSRFALLGMLAQSLVIPLTLSLIAYLLGRKHTEIGLQIPTAFALFFLFIGAAGSLPMMISLKQADYYMLAAMPFYALALASFAVKYVDNCVNTIQNTDIWQKVGMGIFALSLIISFSFSGKIGREKALIHDIKTLAPLFKPGMLLTIPSEMYEEWEMHAYFERYLKVGLDTNAQHIYFLIKKDLNTAIPSDYQLVENVNLDLFWLYTHNN
jgi:Dolichyl-phosphate-mannose-protein mannosyltransferase